jgi:hypothetical protein
VSDTQALLSELARVKALFQLRTISLVIRGEPGAVVPRCDGAHFLTRAIHHALHDGECSDWFVRAHDPRGEFADRDRPVVAGGEVFNFLHDEAR